MGCGLTAVLARTAGLAIWIAGVVAYRGGFTFSVVAQGRLQHRPFGMPHRGDADAFRLGVQFADGRKATDWTVFRSPESGELDLRSLGSGGSGASYRFHWQLTPLPPAGPMVVAIRWNDAGVPETLTEVDCEPIREAAARSQPIWPSR